ncbi:MAG: sulfotransferase, partial [Anaerolineales bacterium]|nr:sulfotransferase [Anaerolineales bacterium]
MLMEESARIGRESEKPIFLLGAHKSGTTLLRSLFDAHPDLFVVPKEIHFFQHSGCWIDYAIRRQVPYHVSQAMWIEQLTKMLIEYNTKQVKHADNPTIGAWDTDIFRQSLAGMSLETPSNRIRAVFAALHLSLYGQPLGDDKRIVEKSVENAEFALDLADLYPNATFIHIVRNPYAN